MVVDGIEIDVLGKMQNQWLAYTQNCDGVSQPQADQENFQAVQIAIQSYSPPHVGADADLTRSADNR